MRQVKTMKKSELNSTAKAGIKKIQKEIEAALITKLKAVTGKLGEATDKLEKEILKGSKKLAKKVVKELKIDQPAVAVPAIVQKNKIEPVADTKPEKKAIPAKPVPEKAPSAPAKSIKK